MKTKLLILILVLGIGTGCSKEGKDAGCGVYRDKALHRDEQGMCYYNDDQGGQVYFGGADRCTCEIIKN